MTKPLVAFVRTSIALSLATLAFWTVWRIVAGSVPTDTTFGITLSRWWLAACAPILAAVIVWVKWWEKRNAEASFGRLLFNSTLPSACWAGYLTGLVAGTLISLLTMIGYPLLIALIGLIATSSPTKRAFRWLLTEDPTPHS